MLFAKEQELIAERFLKLPIVQKYEVTGKEKDGFWAEVELDDGFELKMFVTVMEDAYPALIIEKIKKFSFVGKREYLIIIAPYVSAAAAKLCEESGVGYFDHAGNCLFSGHSIYLCVKGNKNPSPKKYRQNSVFERSAEVSSVILRELFRDVQRPWKLLHLAEQAGCSIGQVSKVKEFLCRNAWAEMTRDGLEILQAKMILQEWSKVYGKKTPSVYNCYSLDKMADLEKKLVLMKEQMGIDYYLTGFSGGVRYSPVVRYNRVHVYIHPENIKEGMEFLECKEVESGQNVIIFPIEEECCVKNAQNRDGYSVASPVQVYLDCMQLKGRGEEMAEAVMRKEILK